MSIAYTPTPPSGLGDASNDGCCSAFAAKPSAEEMDPDLLPVKRPPAPAPAPTFALLPAGTVHSSQPPAMPRPMANAAPPRAPTVSTDPLQLIAACLSIPPELARLVWSYVDTSPAELHLFTGYNEFVQQLRSGFGNAVVARCTIANYHVDRTLVASSVTHFVALELQSLVQPFAGNTRYSYSTKAVHNHLPLLPPLLRVLAVALPGTLRRHIAGADASAGGGKASALPDGWRELSSRDFWKEIERILPPPLQRAALTAAAAAASLSSSALRRAPAAPSTPSTKIGTSKSSSSPPSTSPPSTSPPSVSFIDSKHTPTSAGAATTSGGNGNGTSLTTGLLTAEKAAAEAHTKNETIRKSFDALLLKYLLPAHHPHAGSSADGKSGAARGSNGAGSGAGLGVALYAETYFERNEYSRTERPSVSMSARGGAVTAELSTSGGSGGVKKKRLFVINHSYRGNVALQFDQPAAF